MNEVENLNRRKSRIANAVFFFISGFAYGLGIRNTSIRNNFHLSDSMPGTLLFAISIGLLCTLPLTLLSIGRNSSKKIILIGLLFFNGILCRTGFVSEIWQVFIILFCFSSSCQFPRRNFEYQLSGFYHCTSANWLYF